MDQAIARCTDAIDHGEQLSDRGDQRRKVVSMQRNPQLWQAVGECDMVLADGQAVVWASRVLGAPLPERVAGVDLFMNLLAAAEDRGDRVYFLGARPEVLAAMLERGGRRFPRLLVAGAHDGYYRVGQEGEIAEDIRRGQTDMLFVGMSSPRKELFLDEWGTATKAHVVHGVGGSFDVLAGLTRRAPIWYQHTAWNGCTGRTRNQSASADGTWPRTCRSWSWWAREKLRRERGRPSQRPAGDQASRDKAGERA